MTKIKFSTWLSTAGLGLLVVSAVVLAIAYFFPGTAVAQSVARLFPLPIASIGLSDIVTSRELAEDMDSIRRFYESQDFERVGMRVDFSTPEGSQRLKLREKDLLNKMLEDRAIVRLANEAGIAVTPDEARKGLEAKMAELGVGSSVEQNLARLYGWTLSDFEEKVVRPNLYEAKLLERYRSEDHGKSAAQAKVQRAAEALKAKKNFADVAREFSEGRTAADGGDLGWFSIDDLAPDLKGPVENAKRGVPTSIIESDLGFHILLLEESKLEDGKRLYHLRQIFARKPSFADWLTEAMRRMPVKVYSRDYRWNAENATVEFRKEELRTFEKKLLEEAEGDPTLLL